MNPQLKNTLIGAFVAIAIGLIVGMILFIEPSSGDGKQEIRVYFTNISGITTGTRVNLAGQTIGEVHDIRQIPDARQKAPTKDGEAVYFYEVILRVDSKAVIYTTDKIGTKTIGLLGDIVISITPVYLPSNVKPRRVTSECPMYAKSGDAIDDAFKQLTNLASEMDKTFQKVNEWLDENSDNLSDAVHYVGQALKEISIAVKDFNDMDVMQEVKASLANFAKGMELIDEALQKIKDGNGFQDLPVIVNNIRSITDSINTIACTLASGKGSIGPLLMNDEVYFKVNTLLTKANITLNDINQYGLLFSYNNDWKKTRIKKITEMNLIRSPQDFRNYYSKDLDEMNRAVSRIGQLSNSCDSPYFRNHNFQKEFKELQDMLKELQGSLNRVQEELAYPSCSENTSPCVPPPKVESGKNCDASCPASNCERAAPSSPSSSCDSPTKSSETPKQAPFGTSSSVEPGSMGPNNQPQEQKKSVPALKKKSVHLPLEPAITDEDRSMLEELENFLRQRKGR
jgi:phospholipid/cholesterol/gamma-HCH transport system substrate-binding protein